MVDLEHEMDAVRDGLVPAWDAERSARVFAGIGQLERRRALQHTGIAAAALSAAAVVAFAFIPRGEAPESSPVAAPSQPVAPAVVAPRAQPVHAPALVVAAPAPASGVLRLSDGSTVESLAAVTDVGVVRDEPGRVEVALTAGLARFDVVRRPARSFEVTVGAWRVVVVGTRFDVERTADGVRVAVERGLVRVQGPGGERALAAGESASFAEPARARARDASEVTRASGTPARVQDWRHLIHGGDHDGAYRLLAQGAHVADDPWALMDAADAARLSGHEDGAVTYLHRVVRDHEASPVAPLAAFTLGRIALDRLGRPHDAAQAFAAARALAPTGSLAQDALAREVEAWSKAGDAQKAYERAREYVAMFPDGRRLTAVQRFGGLD